MPLICVASPKGGVGKTTLAANMAHALVREGRRVVAIDLDPQNALRLHFGVKLSETDGFTCRLAQAPDWRCALRPTRAGPLLLAHGRADCRAALQLAAVLDATPGLLADPLAEMLADPDLIVVADTSPGASAALAALLPLADLLVSVLLVDATSISLIPAIEAGDAYGMGMQDAPGGARALYLLNQFDPRTRLGPGLHDSVRRRLGGGLLGVIYRDEAVAEAVAAQRLIAEHATHSRAGRDIALVARRIGALLDLAPARVGRQAPPDRPPAAPRRAEALPASFGLGAGLA